uniref:Auxin-responsive protein n=1 Tax=Leersia perrieri TaxID=77586 RepID=A0A0D9VMP2_9ORYZ
MRGGGAAAAEEEVEADEEVEESSAGAGDEEEEEELELGLSLGSKKHQQQQMTPSPKRAKAEEGPTATTSPGTVASGHPHSSFGVVGWPPIRQFRMNSLFNQAKENTSEADTKKTATNESEMHKDKEESEKKVRVAGWVKVNMDGEVIGRKVDLNAHRSYKTLALALELMFTKSSEIPGYSQDSCFNKRQSLRACNEMKSYAAGEA